MFFSGTGAWACLQVFTEYALGSIDVHFFSSDNIRHEKPSYGETMLYWLILLQLCLQNILLPFYSDIENSPLPLQVSYLVIHIINRYTKYCFHINLNLFNLIEVSELFFCLSWEGRVQFNAVHASHPTTVLGNGYSG